MNKPDTADNKQERIQDLKITAKVLATAFGIGCGLIALRFVVLHFFGGGAPKGWTATGQTFVALLWGAAWFAIAFVFGFLFGIPKALQSPPTSVPAGAGAGLQTPGEPERAGSGLKVNTNLEEISDWLTKILVGATLTQLIKVPDAIKRAADFMATNGGAGPTPFAAAILLYFSAIGFFAGYVLTRMFFSLAFSRFDRGLSSKNLDALADRLINPEAEPEIQEDAYNSIIYEYLYEPSPAGFQKAIKYANQFLQQNKPTRSSIYINLASAYGQQYRYLKEHGAKPEELQRVRNLALDTVQKATALDPSSKLRLRELLHPQPGAEDNDLQVFEQDKDFDDVIDSTA